jgi:SAM-dependent methyltransferase
MPVKSLIGKVHGDLIFGRRVTVLAEAICAMLPKEASVVDVGCGDGTIASLCQAKRPDIGIEGIDVFVRPHTKVPVQGFDGETLPFESKSRDVVTFVDVLHHTQNPARLLQEAARVARKAVIIKDHLANNRFDFSVLALMDWVGNAPHGVTLPYNYLSQDEWDRLVAQQGLRGEQVITALPLYSYPLNIAFGRNLHFLGRFSPTAEYDQAA